MATIRLKPTSTQLDESFSLNGAATVHEAVDDDPGPPEDPDDNTTYASRYYGSDQRFRCGIEPMPSATSITSVTLYARGQTIAAPANGWAMYIYTNGTNYDDSYRTNTTWTTYSNTWITNPNTGDAWTKDEIDNLHIGFLAGGDSPTKEKYCTMIFLEVEYTPLPAQVEDTRTVGSQILRLRRRPPRTVTQTAPLWFLDNELLSDYALSHFAWPAPDGAGAGIEKWQRRLMMMLRSELDLESMQLKVTGYDKRPYLTRHWDIGQSKISADAVADGIARLSIGTRSFSRASKAWIPDPSDGRIVQVAEEEEKHAEKGMLLEGEASNYIKNSSIKDGVASNWSAIASGVLSDDSDNLLFDSDVTAQSANVAGSSGDGIQSAASNTVPNEITTFSFDVFGAAGTWDLQRASDSWYWNNTSKAWENSRPGNTFSAITAFDDDERIVSNIITAVGSTTTMTAEFRLTGATTEFNLGHVQLEANRWASSRIVTSGSTVTRAIDGLDISNDTGARIWEPELGSFKCEVIPNWNSADLPTDKAMFIVSAEYDASNADQVYYWSTTGQWVFWRKLTGGNCLALFTAAVTKGTTYQIGARWTGVEGELDLSVARDFDGSSDYYTRASDLTGNADSKKGIISAWVRLDGGDGNGMYVIVNDAIRFYLARHSSNKFLVYARNSVGTVILSSYTSSVYTTSSDWIHILSSWDLLTSTVHIYINDVDDKGSTTADNDTVDYTRPDWAIGASDAGANQFNGAIAELYFEPGEYLDFSVEANRLKFITASNAPADLGFDGSTPTGSPPLIYLPDGDGGNNHATGGNFIENGSPDLVTGPAPSPTISIFVDGTKGTDDSICTPPTPPSSMTIDIGDSQDSDYFEGYIRYIDSVPFVLTDEEMAR